MTKHSLHFSLVIFAFSILQLAHADYLSWKELEARFKSQNLNTKALSHVACFFSNYEDKVFHRKNPSNQAFLNRCFGDSKITLDRKRVFAMIDYTASSDKKRMLLVDRQSGEVSMMAVAHGRYNASMLNVKLSTNKNTIRTARYFSNDLGSNAPSTGFFIAGHDYIGKFGRSVILHGLEEEVNDNACERAVVIHKHLMVSKSKAYIQSSGCPMVNKDYLDHVANLLQGESDDQDRLTSSGGLVFIYGPREASWEPSTCDGQISLD